jgi:hypothetical protein
VLHVDALLLHFIMIVELIDPTEISVLLLFDCLNHFLVTLALQIQVELTMVKEEKLTVKILLTISSSTS